MPTPENTHQPLRLFFSYAHEDKDFRDALQVHLSGLKKRGIINDWYDGGITAGSEWSKEISSNLESSQIILLLISPSFIASEYCYDFEMKRALEKHEARESRVIPVLIRDVDDWGSYPFAKLQVVPRGAVPVENWGNQNEAWVDVARNIRLACKAVLEMQQALEGSVSKRTEGVAAKPDEVVLSGSSVQLVNPSPETIEGLERIREISMDVPHNRQAAGVQAPGLPEDRKEARQNIDDALHVMNRAAEHGGEAVEDLHAGDVQVSRVDLLLKKAILLHAEAEEACLDECSPEDRTKATYTSKLKEAYDLLCEANKTDPTNTEVLLQMAQLLVELTPDDPGDEKKLLNRIRKLLSEPKTDAESFRLARATYMMAMSGKPPQLDLLREPRAVFERLSRVEWVQQIDRVLAEANAIDSEAPEVSQKKRSRAKQASSARNIEEEEREEAEITPTADFQPSGQWQFTVNDAVGSVLHLNFNPDGSFYGSQAVTLTGMTFQVSGRWNFNPFNRVLQLQGQALGLSNQFMLGISIQGPQGNGFHGFGTDGYAYFINKGGSQSQTFNADFGTNPNFSNFGF